MKKIFMVVLFVFAVIGMISCTSNQRARSFGGSSIENLEPGKKLLNATWKQDDLWLLTRPMNSTDVAETYVFVESSSYGLMNGKVTIKESK